MKVSPFAPVNCTYGAPMGRRDGREPVNPQRRICVRFQHGGDGYDRGGAYWGLPSNVWAVWNAGEPETIKYVRAWSRDAARSQATPTSEKE